MRLLLLTPPFTQINTPYPATAYLTAYLRGLGYSVEQRDLGLNVALRLFSHEGLAAVLEHARISLPKLDEWGAEVVDFFLSARMEYLTCIEPTIRFLQGHDDSLALRICSRKWLPEGPRFAPLNEHDVLLESFGPLGVRDQAKYLASLFLDDIADLVRLVVDPLFQLSRYAEQLASSKASFTPLYERLTSSEPSLIDQWICEEVEKLQQELRPDVVGLSCPFPGNAYGALKAAAEFRRLAPQIKVLMGGGFVNTELRTLEDVRVFEFIDYLTFDDGEKPLELLLKHLAGQSDKSQLLRTMWCEPGEVIYLKGDSRDVPFKDLPAPTYHGLPLHQYVSMMEMPNPMHRLWSDFRWNKMILAHGCYWKQCTFCDVSLDYIQRFEPARVESIVANMKQVAQESGSSGFHFVDEAAPPAILKSLSEKLIEQNLSFTWWGNLRFDKQFTGDVAQKMAEAGCVAVTGGLEVASPRLLQLINKGVSIEQVARVTKAFAEAGIFVHAYLMYGFPSQTEQETLDSLEIVRQLFQAGCLHSAHWHRFVATEHSPVGLQPEKFGITLRREERPEQGWFARNAIDFQDQVKCDHDALGQGLRRALYNYMHGIGMDQNVGVWFDRPTSKTTLNRNLIHRALQAETSHERNRAVPN
ncbi:MAG: radical SAM protein [Bdellovibrionales bacterium]